MNLLQKVLKTTKIDPIIEYTSVGKNKVIGFRGVRENLGTSLFLLHCALELAEQDLHVCIVDLDFNNPNPLLSTTKTANILLKWNNSRENINNIVNKTLYTPNLSYVGTSSASNIIDFVPMKIDKAYIAQKAEVIKTMFDELKEKFDVVLVDLCPDIRLVEVYIPLQLCDHVITLTGYDRQCLNKLQKDFSIASGFIKDENMCTLVHVTDMMELDGNYHKVNNKFNKIASISKSKNIAERGILTNIKIPKNLNNVGDYDEHLYYKGVKDVVAFLKGEEKPKDD